MAFKDVIWKPTAMVRTVVEITLTDPHDVRDASYLPADASWDTLTLRLCDGGDTETRGLLVSGSNSYWPNLIGIDESSADVNWRGNVQDTDVVLTLANHRVALQKRASASPQETTNLDVVLSQLFRSYHPTTVVVKKFAKLPNAASWEEQQIFAGKAVDVSGLDELRIYCVEDRGFDHDIPDTSAPTGGLGPAIISKQDYPKAPKASFGKHLPIAYSKEYRAILGNSGANLYTNPRYMNALWPATILEAVYDSAGGGRSSRIIFTKSPNQTVPTGLMEAFLWLPEVQSLALIDNTGQQKTAFEQYQNVPTNLLAVVPINPNRFKASANCTNPGYAFDGRHDTQAVLANAGATAYLEAYIPNFPQLGKIANVYTYIQITNASTGAGAGAGTPNGYFGIFNGAVGDWHIKDATAGFPTNPKEFAKTDLDTTAASFSKWSDAWLKGVNKWDDPRNPWGRWAWEGHDHAGAIQDCYFRVEVTQNGATMHLISCGLAIEFYPHGFDPTKTVVVDRNTGQGRTRK